MFDYKPYVPVAQRRKNAQQKLAKLKKKGEPVAPVVIEGRHIAHTFWGKAWCENLERYSDYANRLPRGRSYVRNGSVLDLQIAEGTVRAHVSGSELYHVDVSVAALPSARWQALCGDCAAEINSLVELLQGRFSKGVMERICKPKVGLFPAPAEIDFECSCPDFARLCKHVAAVLYGIGARLDQQPELLFRLRKVDESELIARASSGLSLARKPPSARRLQGAKLSELFGLDIVEPPEPGATKRKPARKRAR